MHDGSQMKAARVNHRKARRIRLEPFDADPPCHWGHEVTRWINPANGILPDDAATLDHVKSQLKRHPKDQTEVVLACYRCNRELNERETAQMSDEDKWKRCGRWPREARNAD